MRERTKREILELLDTVNEALCHLQAVRRAGSLLSDCRAAIAAIGRSLAEDGDAHTLLSRKLQRFAAALAKAAQQGTALKQAEVLALAEELHRLRRKVAGMRARLEIVFLPYKASMWDSLESIWCAAAADPDCNAYVVPIPYYDLHPDHTAAKFHYEGDLYPADVPITDYRTYDLATRRPDVIYIHNPYDGCNCVTSVDPAYYSERLKQYTEMLVYVPYFVVAGDKISEHFCQTPGVYHADRVIVQSEAIKKAYAKYIPAEKILALGSPKFDKVAWMMKHLPAMPKEWAEIARGRKLVLYNTHLSPLIVDDGSVCRKLRYVFSVFAGREDVCLLWRPHPLSEATMQSMNLKPLAEYLQLVEMFKQKKLGIFDDSPDVHRAIALSDAYYGDASSLVALYESTGKPILIQAIGVVDQPCQAVAIEDGIVEDDYVWLVLGFFNGLFKMKLDSGEFHLVGKFPEEEEKKTLYEQIIELEEKLYFIPQDAESIAEFDRKKMTFKRYPLFPYMKQYNRSNKFHGVLIENRYIWLMPVSAQVILRFDTATGEITTYDEWYKKLRNYVTDENGTLFLIGFEIDKFYWSPFRQGNLLVKFNLTNAQMQIYKIGETIEPYLSLSYHEKCFYILPENCKRLICWESNKKEIIKVYELPRKVGVKAYYFGRSICVGNNIWLFPFLGKEIVKFNISNKKFEVFHEYPQEFEYITERPGFRWKMKRIKMENGMITIYPTISNMILRINTKTKNVFYWKIFTPKVIERLSEISFFDNIENFKSRIFLEDDMYRNILGYLRFIKKENVTLKGILCNSIAGKRIYDSIKVDFLYK